MTRHAVALSAVALLLATATAVADERADRARATVEAFGRNIRSFERYRCRFAICHGTAATLDDLKADRYDLFSMGAHLTVADGPRLKYHRFGRTPIFRGTKMAYESLVERFTYLTDGTTDFHYEYGGYAAVYAAGWPNSPGEATPLTLGMYDLRRRLAPDTLLANPAEFTFAPDDLPATDGRPTVAARFAGKVETIALTWRFAFDPARGHLPVRMVASDGISPQSEVWLLEARDCGGGRFFPTKYVSFHHPRTSDRPLDMRLYVVTELDPDYTPTREDLTVTLPAGTQVSLQLQQSSVWPRSFGLPTTLHADDLSAVTANLEAQAPRRLDRSRLRELAGRFWPWGAALAGGLGVIVLAQLWLVGRRRRQPRLHG
ncbi:MAG TPA: hypothetical protein VM533_19560 [Fimbriiglobus sp.]|jgi:hypothetical protein|nr:hypothetical protein [Fimbriiglobus sp.]